MDDQTKLLNTFDDMKLYDGYGIDTRKNSYAWIDLDRERLIKMDERSEVSVTQNDNHLELILNAGNLLFGISTPLDEDESLNIQTSFL
jgi:hypothetical protein